MINRILISFQVLLGEIRRIQGEILTKIHEILSWLLIILDEMHGILVENLRFLDELRRIPGLHENQD